MRNPCKGMDAVHSTVDSETLITSIREGCEFLTSQQTQNGAIRGFLLFPGASTTWMTAHIALVTEGVSAMSSFRTCAASFLRGLSDEDRGWGYNRRVGIDVDSTTQSLLVLNSAGIDVPEFILKWVLAAQHPCGGFPTYVPSGAVDQPSNGWQTPHVDVTLLVVLLLRRLDVEKAAQEAAICWIASEFERRDLYSYWWPGSAYSLWAISFADMLGEHFIDKAEMALRQSAEAPFLPMAISAAAAVSVDPESISENIGYLLSLQLRDGSWPCGRCLRVTHPSHGSDQNQMPGRVYADRRRGISTAHAIAALSSYLQAGAQSAERRLFRG